MTATPKAARKLAVTSVPEQDGAVIVVSATLQSGEKLGYSVSVNDPQILDFAAYGVSKKIREVVAGVDDSKYAETINEMFEAFAKGEWSAGRSGDAEPSGGYLAKAIAQLSGKSIEEANEFVQGLEADVRKAMQTENEDVVKVINELKAEAALARAKKKGTGETATAAQSALLGFMS